MFRAVYASNSDIKPIIKDKYEAIHMKYSPGFDENGKPCVGLRSVEAVTVNDLWYLVAGDVFYKGKKLNSVEEISDHVSDAKDLKVNIRFQFTDKNMVIRAMCFGGCKVICNEWNGGIDYSKSGILTVSMKDI